MSAARLAIVVAAVVLLAAGTWYWTAGRPSGPPPGFAMSNGRLEAERIDVATKFAGRLSEILVAEGDTVRAGAVVARLESTEIEARLREARANVRQAEELLNEAEALAAQRESELEFADRELARAATLEGRGYAPGATLDLRRLQRATAAATLTSARAGIARATATVEASRATVERLEADLVEYALRAPRAGRVQYRLAEPGAVLAAGGRILTLLDLADVYLNIYLPTGQAGRLEYGSEARIIFDAAPEYVVPATVTFVAAEAQFTPKYVETEAEREKLVFRVKVTIPADLLRRYESIVKSGVPGVAYVRLDPGAAWPDELRVRLPDDA